MDNFFIFFHFFHPSNLVCDLKLERGHPNILSMFLWKPVIKILYHNLQNEHSTTYLRFSARNLSSLDQ